MAATDPPRSARVRWSLTIHGQRLQSLVDSDLIPPGGTLLDYGCGERPYEAMFRRKFERYVGADLAANARADLTLSETGEVPATSGSVDCVLSSQVLEHVGDPRVYLEEALRVLRPGGSLLISIPGVWPYHPHPTDYWRWTKDGIEREISRAGFELVRTESVFGPESAVLQLWQDLTFERLPRWLRLFYIRVIQALIGFIERRRTPVACNDASIYVVLARKPG